MEKIEKKKIMKKKGRKMKKLIHKLLKHLFYLCTSRCNEWYDSHDQQTSTAECRNIYIWIVIRMYKNFSGEMISAGEEQQESEKKGHPAHDDLQFIKKTGLPVRTKRKTEKRKTK